MLAAGGQRIPLSYAVVRILSGRRWSPPCLGYSYPRDRISPASAVLIFERLARMPKPLRVICRKLCEVRFLGGHRKLAEAACTHFIEHFDIPISKDIRDFFERIDALEEYLSKQSIDALHTIRKFGNTAVHDPSSSSDPRQIGAM